ncbi:MAG: efflux RND transporter permease subunit [Pseudomonadota bacterium]
MHGLVAWWARNSVAANLLMVAAIIGGAFSMSILEREIFPAGEGNVVSVSISWPGASPQDVEEQLVLRIEGAVADIPGLNRTEGVARENFANVNVIAKSSTDMDVFVDEVRQRVNQINNLPQSSFPPQISRAAFEQPFLGLAIHGDVDPVTLKRVAQRVRDRIASISGAGGERAEVDGVLQREVSIEVSQTALRQYNMTFNEIAQAIQNSSLNSSGGSLRTGIGDVSVQTRQLADTEEAFRNIVVRQDPVNGTIRVGDVATVTDGFVDQDIDIRYNGELSAFIWINNPEDMQIVQYSDAIKKFMEEANSDITIMPSAVKLDILYDQSDAFKGRMQTISSSALLGLVLVLIILFLFLRPAVGLWVTVGIATAFAGGIMLLPFFDVSLNLLSLFAVLLVIGVVVDDAIVVGENIHRQVESGQREGLDAAIVGTQLVMKPVIFGVITTIIMFLPWLFLEGGASQFTRQISLVVIAALSFSLIESMLILPAHLAHLKPQKKVKTGIIAVQARIADSLLWVANTIYRPILEAAIKYRYATAAFFISLFLIAQSMVGNGFVKQSFFPEIESDLVIVTIDMPQGTPFSRIEQVRDQLAAGLDVYKVEAKEEIPGVGEIVRDATIAAFSNRVQSWIGLIPPEERPEGLSTKQLAEGLREAVGPIPDAEDVLFNFTFNDSRSGVRFALQGEDIDLLQEAVAEVKQKLAEFDSLYDIGDNFTSSVDEIRLELKPGAETLGITLADVSQQVNQAYFGALAQTQARDSEDIEVRVRLDQGARRSVDSLGQLLIRTQDGREIPVNQVVDISFAPGVTAIPRRDRLRSISVGGRLRGDADGLGEIYRQLEQSFWPAFEDKYPTVKRVEVGDQEEQAKFFTDITNKFMMALFAMYAMLAIAFRSYWQPLLVMTAIPFGYAGAVFGTYIVGTELALFSYFGIGAAAGVVINDNLVLLDYANRRRSEGVGAVQALVDAGVSRFRPVLLTSITTVVGILPMIAEKSVQAQFLRPMVVALGSAVAFALFLSLFLIPALYAIGAEMARAARWIWTSEPFRSIGEGYEGVAYVDEEELQHAGVANPQPAE